MHLHSFNHNFWTGNSHLSEMGFPGGASGKEKRESEVAHPCPTLWDCIDSSLHQAPASMDFLGKSTEVGCHFRLQGIFPTQGWNPRPPHCRQTLYHLIHQGSPEEPIHQCTRHKKCSFSPCIGKIPWRRARQPTPGLLPGESHGQRSLAGYSPWGCKELDTTEVTEHTFI